MERALLSDILHWTVFVSCPISSPAYGATLIEHSLIEVGLSGSVKVDSQVDAAQGKVEFAVIMWFGDSLKFKIFFDNGCNVVFFCFLLFSCTKNPGGHAGRRNLHGKNGELQRQSKESLFWGRRLRSSSTCGAFTSCFLFNSRVTSFKSVTRNQAWLLANPQKNCSRMSCLVWCTIHEIDEYYTCFFTWLFIIWFISIWGCCLLTDMMNSIHSSSPSMQRAITWSLTRLTRWKAASLLIRFISDC